jgi:hypothetical protein
VVGWLVVGGWWLVVGHRLTADGFGQGLNSTPTNGKNTPTNGKTCSVDKMHGKAKKPLYG